MSGAGTERPDKSELSSLQAEAAGFGAFAPVAAAALFARLVLSPWTGYEGDLNTFLAWGLRLADIGPANFFEEGYWCDYLPGYLYVLWILGFIAGPVPQPVQYGLLKLPSILADVGTAYLIWRLVRPTNENRKLWVPIVYLANPAVWSNSTLWGQADSFHAFWIILGLALLTWKRVEWAAISFGYAIVIKLTAVVILPLAVLYALTQKTSIWRVVVCGLLVALTFGATFLPFAGWDVGETPGLIDARLDKTMGQYGHATVNALNLWYLLQQNWVEHSKELFGVITIKSTAVILVAISQVVSLAFFWISRRDREDALWLSASLVFLSVFLFMHSLHERHMFPLLGVLTLMAAVRNGGLAPLVLVSVTLCINVGLAWHYPSHVSRDLCHPAIAFLICAANLLALPLIAVSFYWKIPLRLQDLFSPLSDQFSTEAVPKYEWSFRAPGKLLVGIVLFALAMRLFRLDAPPERYFDEVYHGYTAQQWVEGNTDAWLWSTKAPDKGCAYEWTHPPGAKLVMAWSMEIFGVKPWAWRLPAALLGSVNVWLIYLIAKRLFRREDLALLSAAFAALDALPLVLSRIGMNDTYMLTAMLLSVLAALQNRYVLSALALGAAAACKWSSAYTVPLLVLIYLVLPSARERWQIDRLLKIVSAYLLVPIVYFASYLPFFFAGHNLGQWWQLQRQMWWYHTRLDATHGYSSPAYLWPLADAGSKLIGKTSRVWLYTHSYTAEEGGGVARKADIHAMGNSVIWLLGLAAIILVGYLAIRRDKSCLILVAGYLAFWAPWLFSPRIMFLYHYLPSLPFLYIALAAGLVRLNISNVAIAGVLGFAALKLAWLYAILTAVVAPDSWKFLRWGIG
jgi:predicted membrane-bound dolichyl-phosphate-mannose-protein mannosyltransferase